MPLLRLWVEQQLIRFASAPFDFLVRRLAAGFHLAWKPGSETSPLSTRFFFLQLLLLQDRNEK